MGVSVNAVTQHASCPLDWQLLVPESWDDDTPATQQRRAACHLPEQVHHRPKWQLVLDMLDELAGWDLHPPVLLADSGYGEVGEFRGGLDARGVPCVVEVRSDTSAYLLPDTLDGDKRAHDRGDVGGAIGGGQRPGTTRRAGYRVRVALRPQRTSGSPGGYWSLVGRRTAVRKPPIQGPSRGRP